MSFNEKDYKAVAAKYAELRDKGADDKQSRKDKAKPFQEMIAMEREAAREGIHAGNGQVLERRGPSKRSMQEEYVRKFEQTGGDGSPPPTVKIVDRANPSERPFVGTLADYHRKRLLGR